MKNKIILLLLFMFVVFMAGITLYTILRFVEYSVNVTIKVSMAFDIERIELYKRLTLKPINYHNYFMGKLREAIAFWKACLNMVWFYTPGQREIIVDHLEYLLKVQTKYIEGFGNGIER